MFTYSGELVTGMPRSCVGTLPTMFGADVRAHDLFEKRLQHIVRATVGR